MFWMKWICREVRGASLPWPSTWTMFWDREDETAADRAAPGGHAAFSSGTKKKKKKPSKPTAAAVHRTCCRGGRSPLAGRVVAQLGLNAVGSPQARLWREEGRGRLAGGGLLGRGGSGLAFALIHLPITEAELVIGPTGAAMQRGWRSEPFWGRASLPSRRPLAPPP